MKEDSLYTVRRCASIRAKSPEDAATILLGEGERLVKPSYSLSEGPEAPGYYAGEGWGVCADGLDLHDAIEVHLIVEG